MTMERRIRALERRPGRVAEPDRHRDELLNMLCRVGDRLGPQHSDQNLGRYSRMETAAVAMWLGRNASPVLRAKVHEIAQSDEAGDACKVLFRGIARTFFGEGEAAP